MKSFEEQIPDSAVIHRLTDSGQVAVDMVAHHTSPYHKDITELYIEGESDYYRVHPGGTIRRIMPPGQYWYRVTKAEGNRIRNILKEVL